MKIIRYLLIFLVAISPAIYLLISGQVDFPLFDRKSSSTVKTELSAKEKNDQKVDEGIQAFKEIYDAEFSAYKSAIINQWGEFKEVPTSVWLSYEQANSIRRSVNYDTAEVQVDMLINKGIKIDQVKGEMDKAVYRLLNSSEQDAYNTDVVANRVEQKLSGFQDIMLQGELSDERLFSMQDLLALNISHGGFMKVWAQAGNAAQSFVVPSAREDKEILRVSFKVPHSIHRKAEKYAKTVAKAALKENINNELIYAIMETESSFNPLAKSYIPAYGLMQIVPRTAGKDATSYLYGKAKLLAPSFLYKPKNNIEIGAAYLHVLQYRYMRKVKNRESRLYCAIAAYNTGASNVAKAFIEKASFKKAVPEINKLSPQQVLHKLTHYLPRKETRNYIQKVSERMKKYL